MVVKLTVMKAMKILCQKENNDVSVNSDDESDVENESVLSVKRQRTQEWKWNKVDDSYTPQKIPFTATSGVVNQVQCVSESFKLFFDNEILRTIVDETNRYANDFLNSKKDDLSPRSRVRDWKNVDCDELYMFISDYRCSWELFRSLP